MDTIQRPALGEEQFLGALYDARRDCFLPTSPFADGVPTNASHVAWHEAKSVSLCDSTDQEAKFRTFALPPTLAASCLAGWVALDGSARFLQPSEPRKEEEVYFALCFSQSTITQDLDIGHTEIDEAIESAASRESAATHVVTQILWGASCTVTAHGPVPDRGERESISERFKEASRKLDKFKKAGLELRTLQRMVDDILDPSLCLQCHSDLIPANAPPLTTLPLIKDHLEKIFDLADMGYGEARALSYTLIPLESVLMQSRRARTRFDPVGQLTPNHFETILGLYDSLGNARRCLEEYYKRLKKHRASVRSDHRADVQDAVQEITAAESRFKNKFSTLLTLVRAGHAHEREVESFINEFVLGESSPSHLLSIMDESSGKLDFIETMKSKGVPCTDARDFDERTVGNCFVLYFSEDAMKHPSWKENLDVANQVLDAKSATLIAVDCDAAGHTLDKPRLSKFKNGNLKVMDVIEQRTQEAALSFIRFDNGAIDNSIKDAPSQRKPVRIPCPGGQNCSTREVRDWVCSKCRVKVEFGVVDTYMYCDCGRASMSSISFNCQQGHGDQYTPYPSQYLHRLLQGLPTPPETNVLILGETGVGKSTFINSFINYLSFERLDDAISAKYLNWIIPCSFATQSEGPDGRLLQTQIQIGQDQDERDGSKGDSATQLATVYPVYFGGGLIRLIDTPGIGDTRGPDQDRQNMINILRVLRNYEKLHGILILLKPNNARLTIMFKFCVKELLTQLHRNAAENMVFGFTNTRGSNYQPGDTFQPLEHLLKDYKDVIPGLFKETVYCFDSESFRYLAARYKGIDMGHIDDYRRSWDHSATEARRMVSYFQTRKPHEVRNTVSLNETRYLILQLIQPMAQITTAIADTVKKSENQIKDLQNTRATGEQLKAKLTLTKTVIESTQLDRPRTVCTNSDCCSLSSNDNNLGQQVKLFKSRCHDPCSLQNVPPDVVGAVQIPPCAAFEGGRRSSCVECSHHWKEHQHVVVEYNERTETTTDPTVQNALSRNKDEASAKQMQIQALSTLIKELQEEHRLIQESQARFSHYLQQHSITHYNDATLEYFEHLIKDERSKVGRGQPRTRLDQLENDKSSYEYFVNAMKSGKQSTGRGPLDEKGVYELVKKLYEMKHYGKNLADCAKKTGQAYSATFRERPYRVRGRGGASGGISSFFGGSSSRASVPQVRSSGLSLQRADAPARSWNQPPPPSRPNRPAKLSKTQSKDAKGSHPTPEAPQKWSRALDPRSNNSPPNSNTANSLGSWNHPSDPPRVSMPGAYPGLPGGAQASGAGFQTSPPDTRASAVLSHASFPESDDSDDELITQRNNRFQPPDIVTQPSVSQGGGVRNQLFEEDPQNKLISTSPPSSIATPSAQIFTPTSTSTASTAATGYFRGTSPLNGGSSFGGTPNSSSSQNPSGIQYANGVGYPPQGTYAPGPGGLLSHGYAVPVMLQPSSPNPPYSQQELKKSKSSWFGSVKKKMKSKT